MGSVLVVFKIVYMVIMMLCVGGMMWVVLFLDFVFVLGFNCFYSCGVCILVVEFVFKGVKGVGIVFVSFVMECVVVIYDF